MRLILAPFFNLRSTDLDEVPYEGLRLGWPNKNPTRRRLSTFKWEMLPCVGV